MKTWLLPILFGVVLFPVVVAAATSPQVAGNQGWGPESPYAMLYDSTTQMTIIGQVVRVESVIPTPGSAATVMMLVTTGQGLTVPVYLGPEWYIVDQGVPVVPGDLVQVTGSRVTMGNQSVVIAAWLQRGGRVVVLRDDYGYPVWGWP